MVHFVDAHAVENEKGKFHAPGFSIFNNVKQKDVNIQKMYM